MMRLFRKFFKKPPKQGRPMMPEKLIEIQLSFLNCDRDCPLGNIINELLNHIEWQEYHLRVKKDE